MKYEDVLTVLENMVAGKGIEFVDLCDVLNELSMFSDDGLYYQFNEWVDGSDYDERIDKLQADLGDFDTDSVYTIVHQFGGEGQGDSWDQVIEHKASGRFMSCGGFYASYHGFDTDGCSYVEVKPVPVTVTEYHVI